MLSRRALAGVVLAGPAVRASAQPARRSARVGMLCLATCSGEGYAAFDAEFRQLGWIEGQNLIIDGRAAEGHADRLHALAHDLADRKPDAIVAAGPQPALAVAAVSGVIPPVFSFVADPVRSGLVQSLAHPGRNITGVTAVVPGGYVIKMVELLMELLPQARRIGVIINPSNETKLRLLHEEIPVAGQRFGLEYTAFEARNRDEISAALAAAKSRSVHALRFIGDSIFHTPPGYVPSLANELLLPSMFLPHDVVRDGEA